MSSDVMPPMEPLVRSATVRVCVPTVVKETTVVHRGKDVRAGRRDARREHQRDWRHRGGRVPAQYRGRGVDDWQRQGLRRPGNGQRWVRVDNDYLLVAAASGLIASIVAASR